MEVKKPKGAGNLAKTFFHEDQQTTLAQLYGGGAKGKKANASANSSASGNSTSAGNDTTGGNSTATGSKKSKKKGDDNIGSAIFQYYDNSTGIAQKFAFNLRYYIGAYYDKSKEKNATANSTSGAYPNATNLL